MRVVKLGTSSVTYEIGIFRRGDDDAAATGRFVHVWVNRQTQRPAPIPPRDSRGARAACRREGRVMPTAAAPSALVTCAPMSARDARRRAGAARRVPRRRRSTIGASSAVYGDGGRDALSRALDLFVARPELGFVWLAFADEDGRVRAGRRMRRLPRDLDVARRACREARRRHDRGRLAGARRRQRDARCALR